MLDYISIFNTIAENQVDLISGHERRPWLKIDSTIIFDLDLIEKLIVKFYQANDIRVRDLVGKCFKNVHLLSLWLLESGIKNTITIGNVAVNGNLKFGCGSLTILDDINRGYIESVADAHAWITLHNGEVIDLSIIPSSEGNSFKKKHMKPEKCIYFSSKKYEKIYDHVPFYLGDEYIYRVIMQPDEINIAFAQYSAQRIRDLLSN